MELLANDPLGKTREISRTPLAQCYHKAFSAIEADKNNFLIVATIAEEQGNKIIGTAQLIIITHLTYQGGKRAQIQGVRIDPAYQGKGIGSLIMAWAIAKAKEENCHLIQLTTDKTRPRALEFYKN